MNMEVRAPSYMKDNTTAMSSLFLKTWSTLSPRLISRKWKERYKNSRLTLEVRASLINSIQFCSKLYTVCPYNIRFSNQVSCYSTLKSVNCNEALNIQIFQSPS